MDFGGTIRYDRHRKCREEKEGNDATNLAKSKKIQNIFCKAFACDNL